jgi:hypothetical protein
MGYTQTSDGDVTARVKLVNTDGYIESVITGSKDHVKEIACEIVERYGRGVRQGQETAKQQEAAKNKTASHEPLDRGTSRNFEQAPTTKSSVYCCGCKNWIEMREQWYHRTYLPSWYTGMHTSVADSDDHELLSALQMLYREMQKVAIFAKRAITFEPQRVAKTNACSNDVGHHVGYQGAYSRTTQEISASRG